jgi:hypothetical protein
MIFKRFAVLGALAVLATVAAGCTEEGSTTVSTTSEATGITVGGHGEVVVTPDTGYIEIGVQVSAKTVAEARDLAAKAADAVVKSVKANGVDAKDVQTTQFLIQPQYVYPQNGGEPRISGYMVINTLSVKVRKLDNFSKVIDDATAAGGDESRVQGIRFGLEDNQKALDQAREAAMADAKRKAEQLAKLGGVRLGEPQAITDVTVTRPDEQLKFVAASGPVPPRTGGPTTIEPGSGKITLDLQVRWSISR